MTIGTIKAFSPTRRRFTDPPLCDSPPDRHPTAQTVPPTATRPHSVATALIHGSPALTRRADTPTARAEYAAIHAREDVLRRDLDTEFARSASSPLLRRIRQVIDEYERFSNVFRHSAYGDKALWQAAVLSADAYWCFGEELDRRAALRLFAALGSQFPTSSLNQQVESNVHRLERASARTLAVEATRSRTARSPSVSVRAQRGPDILKSIRRDSLPEALRLTLELERETSFRDERIDDPARVFVDLTDTRASPALKDAALTYNDDVVRHIRVARPQCETTRVVFDLQGAARHSVYQLYDPYRIVIDFERAPAPIVATVAKATLATKNAKAFKNTPGASWTPELLPARPVTIASAAMTMASAPASPTPPTSPSANLKGGYSLSRQLGLGISRIVIDAGHGGHDPGARVKGLSEADLVLDVALRLEKLLAAQPGVVVTLTRRSNVYVPLEERTALANRDGADLFLSIHANASENPKARGLETYFLNFAPNLEAERLAARENAGALRTMHSLPDIVKAIALNNKIDESRDFASFVQASLYDRLRRTNKEARDLGVKQAPFMVLIGATMPSVLAEISFITNRDEASLLKMTGYRQQIAESLLNGIMRYQKALKAALTVAAQ